jgi:hypothetical protein
VKSPEKYPGRIWVWILCSIVLLAGTELAAVDTLSVYRKDGVYHLYDLSEKKDLHRNTSASRIIQKGMDRLGRSGGLLKLSRGTYELEQPVRMKEGVTLSGQGRGTELVGSADMTTLVEIHEVENSGLSWVTLSPGTMVRGSGISVRNASNCLIDNIIVFSFKEYGIKVTEGHRKVKLYRSRLTDNQGANLYMGQSSADAGILEVEDCTFLWGGSGIKAREANGLNVRSSMLYHIDGLPMDLECDRFSVSGTRIFIGESEEAALKYSGKGFDIRNNIMGWVRGHGFVLTGASEGLIRANCIIDLGPPPRDTIFKSGIVLRESSKIDISANAIWNWDDWTQGPMEYGIDEGPECDHNLMEFNNIHFYRSGPIRLQENQSIVRHNVSDPGRDDGNPLMDFNIWRDYVEALIENKVNLDRIHGDLMEDLRVGPDGNYFSVKGSVTGDLVFKTAKASEAIQWALDQTVTGGSVELTEGIFPLDTILTVKANTWLYGQGDKTLLRAAHGLENALILREAYNTSLSDLALEQAGSIITGIFLSNSIFTHIQNVTVKGFREYGLRFDADTENAPPNTWGAAGPSLILVSECSFMENTKTNIYKPVNGAYIGNAVPSMITRNISWGSQVGIDCKGICDNLVGNLILGAGKHAMVIDANSILCTGNMTYQTGGTAIQVFDGKIYYSKGYDRNDNNNNKEANISGNYMIYQRGSGVEISEQWGTISDNYIINCGVGVGYKSGIWLREDSESYVVVDNRIGNGGGHYPLLHGILENGAKNLVSGNWIHHFTGKDVLSRGEATMVTANTASGYTEFKEGSPWAPDDALDRKMSYAAIRDYLEGRAGHTLESMAGATPGKRGPLVD